MLRWGKAEEENWSEEKKEEKHERTDQCSS